MTTDNRKELNMSNEQSSPIEPSLEQAMQHPKGRTFEYEGNDFLWDDTGVHFVLPPPPPLGGPSHFDPSSAKDRVMLSRIRGCLLGGALGDALGYLLEFLGSTQISRNFPSAARKRLIGARGCCISDDTQMTLFSAEGVIRSKQRYADRGLCSIPAVVLGAYQRWLYTQTGEGETLWKNDCSGWLLGVQGLRFRRAPGNTCLSALSNSVRAMEGGRLKSLPSVDEPPNDSKGCGAIMRSAPFGLSSPTPEAAFRFGRDLGVLTHGHPSGYLSAAYFAAVIRGVSREQPLVDVMAGADELLFSASLRPTLLQELLKTYEVDGGCVRCSIRTTRDFLNTLYPKPTEDPQGGQ